MKQYKVAIVGATGLVGIEMKKVLREHAQADRFQIFQFASKERPSDDVLDLQKSQHVLASCDFILNGATSEVAEELRKNLGPNQVLIDNSSAFRLDPEVPLVVPEVNGALLKARPQVVANPNCTAIILTVALNAIKDLGLGRVIVSTYQAISGAGIKALEEFERQQRAVGQNLPIPRPEVLPHRVVNNVFSHNSAIRIDQPAGHGYNDEEWKVVEESRKILDIRHLAISATCVRVPVPRAHTEAVTVDLKEDATLEELRKRFGEGAGLKLVDDWKNNHFPMPVEAENQDLVLVGRIRKDPSLAKTIHFMVAGDQIRKGAASNAIQIMDAYL